MNIGWNKVTWYSKLGALIVLVITIALAFFFWSEYQEIQVLKNSTLIDTPQINRNSIITEEISIVEDSGTIQFNGEILKGETFEREINSNLVFRLVPRVRGWDIQVGNKTNPDLDFSRITPPLRGINSRQLNGWHFRNADNTGPNEGSVNAPQEVREFEFVLNEEDYQLALDALTKLSWPYDYTDEEVDEASQQIYGGLKQGRGILTVTDMEFGNLEPNKEAWFERVKFNVTLTLPTDTSDWQTYTNEEFGFEVRYPAEDWEVSELSPSKLYDYKDSILFDTIPSSAGIFIYVIKFDIKEGQSFEQILFDNTVFGEGDRHPTSLDDFTIREFGGNSFYYVLNYYPHEGQYGVIYYFVETDRVLMFDLTSYTNQIKYEQLYITYDIDDPRLDAEERAMIDDETNHLLLKQILSTFRFIEPIDTSDWQTYRNEEFGFEFQYPGGEYEVIEGVPDPRFPEELLFVGWDFKVSEYCCEFLITISKETIIDYLSKMRKFNEGSYQLLEEATTLAGLNATKVFYKSVPSSRIVFVEILAERNDNLYILETYEGSEYQDVFEGILSTFQFIESIDTAHWQTYRNDEFGFEVKYPAEWSLMDIFVTSASPFHLAIDPAPIDPNVLDVPIAAIQIHLNRCWKQLEKYPCQNTVSEVAGYRKSFIEEETLKERAINISGRDSVRISGMSKNDQPFAAFYTDVVTVPWDNDDQLIIELNKSEFENIFDQILSTFRFIEKSQCSLPSYFGCRAITSGVPPDPNTPPVCGCIPECSSGEYVFVSAGSGFWPDGSQKGTFSCSLGPPPP